MMKIKINGVDRLYKEYSWRLTRRAKKVWQSGLVVGNKSHAETDIFEKSIAKYTGRKYAVAVGSGTDALYFALKVKGVGPGSVVGCPAVSYMATAEAIKRTGAQIYFIDTNENGQMGDISECRITDLVYVNLFGNIDDYDRIQEICNRKKITLFEDGAQSFGSSYKNIQSGKLGDISVLSFSPTKPLPAFGNAGMVLTDSEDEADILKGYRYHGYNGVNINYGYNSCIPESISAQLNFLLSKYKTILKERKTIYKLYCKLLNNYPVTILEPRQNSISNHSKFVIKVKNRDELQNYLKEKGVQTGLVYKEPMSQMKMFATTPYDTSWHQTKVPNAIKFCNCAISLPIYPLLKQKEIEYVCNQIGKFYNA